MTEPKQISPVVSLTFGGIEPSGIGESDGDADGDGEGESDGDADGDGEGESDGDADGDGEGESDGDADGDGEGVGSGAKAGSPQVAPLKLIFLVAELSSTRLVRPELVKSLVGQTSKTRSATTSL